MKRIALLLVIALLTTVLFSCAKPPVEEPTQPSKEDLAPEPSVTETEGDTPEPVDYSNMKVVILLPGVITDGGWCSIGHSIVENLSDKYGMTGSYVENIAVSDMEEYLRMYAEDNYDLIIVHGSQYIDNMIKAAKEFPEINFCVSYGDEDVSEGLNNVGCAGMKNMGIMIGAIMGVLTDDNHVCFLAGEENPVFTGMVNTIEEGVRLTNKECKVDLAYIGTITDQSMAKEMAISYIDAGVDVISSAANAAQVGVLEAAEEKGILCLGTNTDQYELAPDAVVLSVMRNYPAIYENVVIDIANGTFAGGLLDYGLAQNGTLVSEWHGWDEKLPTEKVDEVNRVVAGLLAGEFGDY